MDKIVENMIKAHLNIINQQ